MITYEYPLNERIRTLLRLEDLYDRARDMGGTRLTSSAIPFSQTDWIQHYGPVWESFRDAKKRFDPNNVLTPGQGIFPSAVGERGV